MGNSNVGKIARLVGVTTTMIRKYEQKGILNLKRNPENNYRNMNMDEMGTLIRMRILRQAGFSLDDIHALMNEIEYPDGMAYLEKRQRELDEEIRKCERIKRDIQRWKENLLDVGQGFSFEYMPAMRFIPYMNVNEANLDVDDQDFDEATRLFQSERVLFSGIMYDYSQFKEAEGFPFSTGFFVPDDGSVDRGIRIPAARCLSFSPGISVHRDEPRYPAMIREGIAYLKAQGLEMIPLIYSEITATCHHNDPGRYECYTRIHIPIKE